MILGPKKLLELVKSEKLVEELSDRELTNPEGAGFDLRVGEVYTIEGDGFLGEVERKTPDSTLLMTYEKGAKKTFFVKPGEFYLITTIETVNIPIYLTAHCTPRTTLFRSGLILITGNGAPGYSGKLTFALKNLGSSTIEIEMGARVVHIQFSEVLGDGSQYRGQWQGGRVTTDKKEVQV